VKVLFLAKARQLAFVGHVLRRRGLENLVVSEAIEGRRANRRQRLKYLDSLCASWNDAPLIRSRHMAIYMCVLIDDNVNPTQLIRASEDRVFWHRMVANVVNDAMAP